MSAPFVALQLNSVRDFAMHDMLGTLKSIKEIGYDSVELASTYGVEAARLKEMLDTVGLKAISAHLPFSSFQENVKTTIAGCQAMGIKHLCIPSLPGEQLPGGREYDSTKETLKQAADLCAEAGVRLLYHNHAYEFEVLESGIYILDMLIFDVPGINVQLDTGWAAATGQETASLIEKYADRCVLLHLRDTFMTDNVFEGQPLGKGTLNIPEIIEASIEKNVKGFVVEFKSVPTATSIEAAKESRIFLSNLGL